MTSSVSQTALPKGKRIVSCQARADNPLHGPVFMGAMAFAARGGVKPVAVVGRVPSLHPALGVSRAPALPGVTVAFPETDAAHAAARLAVASLSRVPS